MDGRYAGGAAHDPANRRVVTIPIPPPVQLDWVIMQRFSTMEAARACLQSPEREALLLEIQPALVGPPESARDPSSS